MKICVFCASSESVDNVYFKAAADLGKEIVTRGWGLLYGGTNCGLMREVSDAVKNGGGEVTGIIPQCIVICSLLIHLINKNKCRDIIKL